MNLNLIFILIFLFCFCFISFQCLEFYQNYDYIQKFIEKYYKYEFESSPSYNYTDKTVIDPNDNITDYKKKWRCGYVDKYYQGFSEDGIVIVKDDFGKWELKIDCINYIFDTFYLNYLDPCADGISSKQCTAFKKLKETL